MPLQLWRGLDVRDAEFIVKACAPIGVCKPCAAKKVSPVVACVLHCILEHSAASLCGEKDCGVDAFRVCVNVHIDPLKRAEDLRA